jgi:hypothetical protein
MPLFRRHRGTLEESLQTTIIVKNRKELIKHLIVDWGQWKIFDLSEGIPFELKIEIPYKHLDINNFDTRCGWYTHYVSADIMERGKFTLVGFLSEPMEE